MELGKAKLLSIIEMNVKNLGAGRGPIQEDCIPQGEDKDKNKNPTSATAEKEL